MSRLEKEWYASLKLGFGRNANGHSVLDHREHSGPLLVQRALYPEGPDICHVAIVHPPSGIAGGDNLDIQVSVADGANATVFSPGATRWYKANGRRATQTVTLQVAKGSRLDWLPLENIIFEEADAVSRTIIKLESGAAAIGWDAFQLGRVNKPNYWDAGSIGTETRLKVDGQWLWIDQGTIDAASSLRQSVSGLSGFPVHAALWCFGRKLETGLYDILTKQLPWADDLRGASTMIPYKDQEALYMVRCIGIHMEEIRAVLEHAWAYLRLHVLNTPANPLRLWAT